MDNCTASGTNSVKAINFFGGLVGKVTNANNFIFTNNKIEGTIFLIGNKTDYGEETYEPTYGEFIGVINNYSMDESNTGKDYVSYKTE